MAEKSEKLTQKELKEPDAFQKVGFQASDWLAERGRLLAMIAGAIVAVGLIAAVISYLSTRGENQASQALSDALALMNRPVATEANPSPPAPTAEKPFATQQEKEQAIQKALATLRAEHSGTDAARSAILPLAQAEYRLGNLDPALALYDEFLKGSSAGEPLRALALEGRGYVLEAKGDLQAAISAFQTLSTEKNAGMLGGMGDYHRARLLIQENKLDEAATLLVALPVNHPGSAAARLATERIEELTAKGVKLPQPPAAPAADAG